jgi:transcriptional regulator with XRE-family HTH domain
MCYVFLLNDGIDNLIMNKIVRQRLSDLLTEMQGTMPQRKFAQVLGVAHSSLASWLRCETFPSHDSLERIAEVAKISMDELLQRLRGEVEVKRLQRAEDILPQINVLSPKEQFRLIKLLINQLPEQ